MIGVVLAAVALAAAYAAQMARWLRVLQREHYDPRSIKRFVARWTAPSTPSAKAPTSRRERSALPLGRLVGRRAAPSPTNAPARPQPAPRSRRPFTLSQALIIALFVALGLRAYVLVVLVSVAFGLLCPLGLSPRGTSAPLTWTRRLRTVAIVQLVMSLAIVVPLCFVSEHTIGALIAVWAVPPILDLAARLVAPHEERLARRYVERAGERLVRAHPRVVGITGSYGKTSTKGHLLELLGEGAVASPRSFNNRAGLSRAINELVGDGTLVFIAEMGTYGPGEIRDLASWCRPEVALVTAIGPVHLERMGDLDVIESAKREITELATTVILNVDDERLAQWPATLRDEGKIVVAAGSTSDEASVRVLVEGAQWRVERDGATIATIEATLGVHPTNLACAIAAALVLGVSVDDVVKRARGVRALESRSQVASAPSGVVVIDDTFNANPASARAALDVLRNLDVVGRRVVVTPGLVELGVAQYGENLRLAQRVEAIGAQLVVVARTNADALAAGYRERPRRFDRRSEAVAWVRSSLRAGDAVLYLNDLPDHYP